jgi:hypothetical protein
MEFSNQLAVLISGTISGMILFQTAIIAPSVFKVLDPDQAGAFLRSVFPKLFLVIFILGLVSLVQALLLLDEVIIQKVVSFITVVTMAVCYLIVPATNRARDDKNDVIFKRLHTISVLLTLIALISNVGWVFLN